MHYSICKVENFKPDRKIFSNSKVKKSWFGIRTPDRPHQAFKTLSAGPQQVVLPNVWSISNFIIRKLKFSAQRSNKTRDFQKKNSIRNLSKIALIPELLGF